MAFYMPQFKNLIERILTDLGLYSPSAVNLLLGTAAQESRFGTYLRQVNGPALGVFQCEPETENDIWKNYLKYRPPLSAKIWEITEIIGPCPEKLETDLLYSITICRVHYRRIPAPLPQADNIAQLGQYWKDHYNTAAGKGTVREFVNNYRYFVETNQTGRRTP